ncbi:DUF1772 domain-containing protein [Pseudonocardia sp. NPDC046786]|uniref:DUF1772 domain-containing protein n=1 Tax=Pseudonocardia sp. NPDC046786 TaxID=3155471 RepID=UPI0033FB8699
MTELNRLRPGDLRPAPVVLLPVAALGTGLLAGVYLDWAHTVMPALRTTGDRTFVAAQHALDAAILTPLFLLLFLGAPAATGAAAVLARSRPGRRLPALVLVAFGLHLAAFLITVAVHEPLNLVVRGGGAPGQAADPAVLRAAFDEARWAGWHVVRTVLTVTAFGCLLRALVVAGRSPGGTRR